MPHSFDSNQTDTPTSPTANSPTSPTGTPKPGQKGHWRWLYLQMLASVADNSFMRFNGYTVAGNAFQYRSLQEFHNFLNWVKTQADLEDGVRPYSGRTHAGVGRTNRGGRR